MKSTFSIILFLITTSIIAQDKIFLELNVFNEFSNSSLSFADVKVINTTTNQKLTKKTNFNGNIKIDLFPNMTYILKVSSTSDSSIVIFQEKTIKFNTQGVLLGTDIVSDVKLRPVFQKDGLQFIQDINFNIFSYTLDKMSKLILDNVVDVLIKHPEIKLEINGYASCNLSTDDANSVSVERATVISSYLTSVGIDYKRITAVAWGKTVNMTKCTCIPDKKKDKPCTKKDHLKNSRANLKFTEI